MTIPNLPTDNLYKFLSIAGLVTVILSISSLYFNGKNLNNDIIEINQKIAHYNYEVRYLKCEVSEIDKILDKDFPLPDSTLDKSPIDTVGKCNGVISILKYEYAKNKKFKDENLNYFLEMYTTYLKSLKRLDSVEIEVDYEIRKINYQTKLLKENKMYSILGLIFGSICTVAGFYLWYNKAQKFIDKKMKNEV